MFELFWLSLAVLGSTYVVFPAVVICLSRWHPRHPDVPPVAVDHPLPRMSVIFSFVPPLAGAAPATGAADGTGPPTGLQAVQDRICDLLANGYPTAQLEILAVCDGPLPDRRDRERELAARCGCAPGVPRP
ncbi:MAG: hypothetical protein HY814_10760, partial [Candidatus Riflebacteria bacterium]|nr:hypothetical protein [Candidatus Riflebacteria bacterium]